MDRTRRSETVLVVEDEESVRHLVRKVLEGGGFNVLEASGAREAVYTHENHTGPIDLLLTDIVLSGKSGREIAREFQELRPGIRIIFMSGYSEDIIIRNELKKSKASFLGKPFTPAALLQMVHSALHGPETAIPSPESLHG